MSKMLKKVYAAKRNINYDGGSKKAGTGAGIGRSGGLSRLVASQSSNNNNRLSLGITPVLTYRSNNVFTVNTTINVNDEIKPTLTGVTGIIEYTISRALPTNMNFSTATGTITGTPTTSQVETPYTVTASNTDGIIIISNAFTITINDVAPSFTYASSTGTVDSVYTEIGPSYSTIGTGTIEYAISGALPTGLEFNTTTGRITGTPTTSQVATEYTVTATNTGNAFTSNLFTITINDVAPSFTYASSTGTVDSVYTEIGPSPATSGTGSITYAISGALPTGLEFNTTTGRITGTPTTSQVSTSYTVTATNTGNAFTSNLFTITINDVAPSFTYSSSIDTVNSVFTLIPNVTTGTGIITYTISPTPPLPTGLEFTPTTGRITGTPTTIQAATEYTVTASNTGNSGVTCLPFTIEIQGYIQFVAVGNGGSIMTSSNGTTDWVTRQSPTSNNWRSVTYGNDIFVAIAESGGTGNRVMTSTNGINWASQTTPALGDIEWRSVTYGNGIFVAVARVQQTVATIKCLMTSTNGSDWTLRDTLPSGISFNSVTVGNGRFVAIISSITGAENTGAITSTDGINWTQGNLDKTIGYLSVTYGDGHFVAVKFLGQLSTSPDGINWTTPVIFPSYLFFSVGYGNGVFVVLGLNEIETIVMRSTDRINWDIINIPSTVEYRSVEYRSVTYGNGRFVAVGSVGTGNRVITSTDDGLTWTPYSSADDTKAWNSVTYRP